MARFRRGLLSAGDARGELGLGRSRFYVLYAGYLRACAERRQRSWCPGHSGGNHHCPWPLEVIALLRKLFNARSALSYSFAASEVHRRHDLKVDRASVRRWALAQGLAPDTKYKPTRQPVRHWQVQQIGQLWQYDASPHRWFAQQHEHSFSLAINPMPSPNSGLPSISTSSPCASRLPHKPKVKSVCMISSRNFSPPFCRRASLRTPPSYRSARPNAPAPQQA